VLLAERFLTAVLGSDRVADKVNIYHRHCKINNKPLYCYYAAPLGVQPTEKEKRKWFYYINDAAELLKSNITRQSELNLTLV
jgi:hypothetical protein